MHKENPRLVWTLNKTKFNEICFVFPVFDSAMAENLLNIGGRGGGHEALVSVEMHALFLLTSNKRSSCTSKLGGDPKSLLLVFIET